MAEESRRLGHADRWALCAQPADGCFVGVGLVLDRQPIVRKQGAHSLGRQTEPLLARCTVIKLLARHRRRSFGEIGQ